MIQVLQALPKKTKFLFISSFEKTKKQKKTKGLENQYRAPIFSRYLSFRN